MDPELAAWVKSTVIQYGLPSEEHLINSCRDEYGDDGVAEAKRAAEATLAECEAVPVIRFGDEPTQNERVIVKKLTEDIFIRVWGDDLKDLHIFTFDFVDRHGGHMSTPAGITIIMLNTPTPKEPEVHAPEWILHLADPNLVRNVEKCKEGPLNPKWETFIIEEGARLRITLPGSQQDYYLIIPLHSPPNSNIIEMPGYW